MFQRSLSRDSGHELELARPADRIRLAVRAWRLLGSFRPDTFQLTLWLLLAGHVLLVTGTRGLRPEHLVADLLLLALSLISTRTRELARGALPFWLAGTVLDSQHLWLPLRRTIHTASLAIADARLFPAPDGQPWAWWFSSHTHPALDLITGAAYATYVFVVLAVALVLYLTRREQFHRLSLAFLICTLIACAIYMLYPAAPPWYVQAHGLGPVDLSAAPSPAGALRFDQLLGIDFFQRFYGRNPNVFGAMPSLHTAYPVLAAWSALAAHGRKGLPVLAFALLVAFSALYLDHHYVLDVLAGAAVAVVASLLAAWLRTPVAASAPVPVRTLASSAAPRP